jgi:lambda family phage portal protein
MNGFHDAPKPKPTAGDRLDNLIGFFSPQRGARRKAWRQAGRLTTAFGYRGASKDRLRSDWLPGGGSADEDIIKDLPYLRERSRDLARNDGHAASVVLALTTNTVGTGISPQSRVDGDALGLSEEQTATIQDQIEDAWEQWTPFADAANRLYWVDLLEQIDRQIIENGESFIVARRLGEDEEPWRTFRFCLQTVESDRVDTPGDKIADPTVRAGVQLGDRGQPVGYYIRKAHPGDIWPLKQGSEMFDYFPARDEEGRPQIWHLYHQQRPGQTRGVPFFAPVLNLFKDLCDYMEAEVLAARVSACVALIVKRHNAFDSALQRSTEVTGTTKRRQTLEPGIIEYLEPDESTETLNPTRPNNNFDAFVIRILRTIGAALGLPYELTVKDFSKTNYSSARAALLEARKYFRTRQWRLARQFCQPVYEQVIEEAFLLGMLPGIPDAAFMGDRRSWTRVRWVMPGWDWLDPLKEVQASKEAMAAGLSTQADENASRGLDWQATNEQQQREATDRKNRGLPTIWESSGAPTTPAESTTDEEPPDGERPGDESGDIADSEEASSRAEAYGIAVRAGAITPQSDDEAAFRELLSLPPRSSDVDSAWKEDGGVRRPITLQPPTSSQSTQPVPRPLPDETPPTDNEEPMP